MCKRGGRERKKERGRKRGEMNCKTRNKKELHIYTAGRGSHELGGRAAQTLPFSKQAASLPASGDQSRTKENPLNNSLACKSSGSAQGTGLWASPSL